MVAAVLSFASPAAADEFTDGTLAAATQVQSPPDAGLGTGLADVSWVAGAIDEATAAGAPALQPAPVAVPPPPPPAIVSPPRSTNRYQAAPAQYQSKTTPIAPNDAVPAAAAVNEQPVNVNISVRVLSPGDDGAVSQSNIPADGSPAGGSSAQRQPSSAPDDGRYGEPQPVAADLLPGSAPSVWIWNWNSAAAGGEQGGNSNGDSQYQFDEEWYRGAAANIFEHIPTDIAGDSPVDSAINQVTIWIWNWTWTALQQDDTPAPRDDLPEDGRPSHWYQSRPRPSPARGRHARLSPARLGHLRAAPRRVSPPWLAELVDARTSQSPGGPAVNSEGASKPSPERVPPPDPSLPRLPISLAAAGGPSSGNGFFTGFAVLVAALGVAAIGTVRRLAHEPKSRLPKAHGRRLERPG